MLIRLALSLYMGLGGTGASSRWGAWGVICSRVCDLGPLTQFLQVTQVLVPFSLKLNCTLELTFPEHRV